MPANSSMNLAYFPLGLLPPCDKFLTALLSSLFIARLVCADREGTMEFGRVPKGWKYWCNFVSVWEIARSKLDMFKILNAENFILCIFVQ